MIGRGPIPYYVAPNAAPQPSFLPPPQAMSFPPVPAYVPPQPPVAVAPVGGGWQSGPPVSPVLAAQAAGIAQPTIRGAIPETPPERQPVQPPRPLRLPSPDELGISTTAVIPVAFVAPVPAMPIPNATSAATLDWNQALARFQRLGAQGFHVDQVDGGTRVTVMLSGRQLQATGANDAEAVLEVLRQAEGR